MARAKISEATAYGLATWIIYTIQTLPSSEQETYRRELKQGLEAHTFIIRRKGEPKHDAHELKIQVDEKLEIPNPNDLVRILITDLDRNYNAETSNRIKRLVLERI